MREKYGILIPLHPPHFRTCLAFVWSYCAQVSDPATVPMAFVLSNATEEAQWRSLLIAALSDLTGADGTAACALSWRLTNWEAIMLARDGGERKTLSQACQPHDALRRRRGQYPSHHYGAAANKFRWVALKRVYALLHFGFAHTLALDAEARVLRPTSIRALFDSFYAHPSFWLTRKPSGSPFSAAHQLQYAALRLTDSRAEPALAAAAVSTIAGSSSTSWVRDSLGLSGDAFYFDTQHCARSIVPQHCALPWIELSRDDCACHCDSSRVVDS